jgi:hypothetical protein
MTPAIIAAALDAVLRLLEVVTSIRAQAARTGEWTPEEEAEIDAKLQAAFASDAWKPRV